ncbi:hypothetical protein J5N97_030033 [Dioscorea zingiberensis]|uniref:Protein kinase domain-containing protein n=1 Tax=Dioscorea zingiberensis TaxID=325984 RepID=A0A9D5H3N9_9LILI|nr:hypothetical protein J5N97_030033 [Dioscorea zingiberensis]
MTLPPPPPPLAGANPVTFDRHHLVLGPLMACAALAAVFAAAAVLIFVLCRRRASRRRTGPVEPKVSPVAAETTTTTTTALRRFSYAQLRRATGSFSPSHRLGQGGFGPVFRGALSMGQEVAVKLMEAGSLQGKREFQNELGLAEKMVSSLPSPDHCWIVPPLGYCYSEQNQTTLQRFKGIENGNDDEEPKVVRWILLVYDLTHNGSLQDAMFDRWCPELADWHRRFSVALDIARALQFLHFICNPPVIHGDIKPSNILRDSNLFAWIAHCSLARLKNSITDEPAVIGS